MTVGESNQKEMKNGGSIYIASESISTKTISKQKKEKVRNSSKVTYYSCNKKVCFTYN